MQYYLESISTNIKTNDPELIRSIATVLVEKGESVKMFTEKPQENNNTTKRIYRKHHERPRWKKQEVFFMLDNIDKSNHWLSKQDILRHHTIKAIYAMHYKLNSPKFITPNLKEFKNQWEFIKNNPNKILGI